MLRGICLAALLHLVVAAGLGGDEAISKMPQARDGEVLELDSESLYPSVSGFVI